MVKKINLVLISLFALFIFSCSTKPTFKPHLHPEPAKPTTTISTETIRSGTIEPELITPSTSVSPQAPAQSQTPGIQMPVKTLPRIGLIFSGGGAKAWAHIGFIKEIEKAKWSIHSVAGIEWGSVVAAIYANNFSSNEVEWELSKIKDFENIEETSNIIFNKKSSSDLKIPFACPSLNISKQTIYLLNRGQLNKLIPYCLALPPLSKPFAHSVAEMHDLPGLAQHLRATGANKIILINVLAQNNQRSFTSDNLSTENILWSEAAALMSKKINGIDDIVQINLDDFAIDDINKKREIIAKGAELSYESVKKLTSKYGL